MLFLCKVELLTTGREAIKRVRIPSRCELIKTDRLSASLTTARAGVGRARRVWFEGDDSSETELIIEGVTVSRDSLIQAAFLRQWALEQQHDSRLEYRYEKKHENTLTSESTELTPPTTEIVGPIPENSSVGNMANGEKVVMTRSTAGLFAVERFCGNEEEDIEGFLDAVLISFHPNEIHYDDLPEQEQARLLYMASLLEGQVKRWWKMVERAKKDTWAKATTLMRTRFAHKIGSENTDWVRASVEFTMMEQGSRTDDEYVRHVQELYTILGEPFGQGLASKFV